MGVCVYWEVWKMSSTVNWSYKKCSLVKDEYFEGKGRIKNQWLIMIKKCEWNTQCDYLFNVPRTYWYINLQIKTDLKAITSNNSEKHCEKKPWRTEESDHLLFNWHQPLTRCKNTHKRFFGIHVYASAIIQGDMHTEVFLHISIYQGIDSISAIYNSSLTRLGFFCLKFCIPLENVSLLWRPQNRR